MIYFHNRIDIKGDALGRYEHGEITPSIEMAVRIAGTDAGCKPGLSGGTDRGGTRPAYPQAHRTDLPPVRRATPPGLYAPGRPAAGF